MEGRSVAEVCEHLAIKPHVLRYWEEQVPWLAADRSLAGHRVYHESHIHRLFRLKYLINVRGFTLHGAADQLIHENTGEAVGVKTMLQPLRYQLLELRQKIIASRGSEKEPENEQRNRFAEHPVERYLPGITGMPVPEQLLVLKDYAAFRPEFRLPLVEFLYGSGGVSGDRRLTRTVLRPDDASRDHWFGSRQEPLLIVAPLYNGGTLDDDLNTLYGMLHSSRYSAAILLCEPGNADLFKQTARLTDEFPYRCSVQPLPFFPDVSCANALYITPDRCISQYFPGPGIALQSVFGDQQLFQQSITEDFRDSVVWYRPLGVPGYRFLPPSVSNVLRLCRREHGAIIPVRSAYANEFRILPSIGLLLNNGICSVLQPGLQGCGVVKESVATVNRLDNYDDIHYQEVCRVRSSITDIAQRSLDAVFVLEE